MVREFEQAKREAEGSGEFIRNSGRFPLTAMGDLNTYALFAELFLTLIAPGGRSGIVVPTGIATDTTAKEYFGNITSTRRLVSLISFENESFIFRQVHHSFRFCLLTLAASGFGSGVSSFCFFIRNVAQLADSERFFKLGPDEVRLLNPSTQTCPIFRSQADAALAKRIYSNVPTLTGGATPMDGSWKLLTHTRFFHMAEDSHLFQTAKADDSLPLYEAKLIHLFDHRWATFNLDGSSRETQVSEKQDPGYAIRPRYWVQRHEVDRRAKELGWRRNWIIGYRNITSAHVLRTVIPAVLPLSAAGHSIALCLPVSAKASEATAFLANLSSIVYDYLARQKVGGLNLSFSYLEQVPFVPPKRYASCDLDFISRRVIELTYNSTDLRDWARDMGLEGPPFEFCSDKRATLQSELDAFYAHLYGLNRDELRYILDPADVMGPDYPSETFRVLKNNEIRQFGEYRTQRLVLAAWDRLFGS
jgi:hypothetical protein